MKKGRLEIDGVNKVKFVDNETGADLCKLAPVMKITLEVQRNVNRASITIDAGAMNARAVDCDYELIVDGVPLKDWRIRRKGAE